MIKILLTHIKFPFNLSLGCALAPIVINVFESSSVHPMVSFGLFGIVSAILVLFLSETLHKPLEDEIFEVLQSRNLVKLDNGAEPTKTKNDDGSFYLAANQEITNEQVTENGAKDNSNADLTRKNPKLKK